MSKRQWTSLVIVAVSAAILLVWGLSISRSKPLGGLDFRALYEGAACLIHHHDPFNPAEVKAYYIATGDARLYPGWALYTLTLLNYPPTIYPFTALFAMLPWETARTLWIGLTAVCLLGGALLMWSKAAKEAPLVAGCLIGFLLANSEIILGGGNAAGLVVGFCLISVWCWVEERGEWFGVLCLAVSLAMKPHDGGFIWLYFLLVGMKYRTRAIQTLAMDVAIAVFSVAWVWLVAAHWYPELRQVMAIYSGHGGANDPGIIGGPKSAFRSSSTDVYPGMVCNMQSIVAVFWDEPRFYNPFTYVFCAPFVVIWAFATVRSVFSKERAYLALAAIVPFTLLITYHRTTDTKLLLLTVPACAMLWVRGGVAGRLGLALTALGIVITGDISLTVMGILGGHPDWIHTGFLEKIPKVLIYRPVPIVLMAMGFFYLYVYASSSKSSYEASS